MTGASVSVATGRVVSGEQDLIFIPRNGFAGKRPIFLFHGQLRPAADWNDTIAAYGSTGLAWALARAGLLCIAAYWSGPEWGNSTFRSEVETARTLATSMGAASDKFLCMGASMGAFEVLSLAQHVPSEVAAGVGLIPAVNLDDFRDNNLANAQSYINTAYSLTAGSTSATVPLPSDANAFVNANAAQITAPIKFYGSSADVYANWTYTQQMAVKIGATATDVAPGASPNGGHTEYTIAQAPVSEIVNFMLSHA